MNGFAQASAAPLRVATTLDMVVIGAYLLLILGFGSYFGRFGKNTKDFFFSGQRFSWWLIAMSMAATGIGAHSFMKYAQAGYQNGLSSGMSYTNDWFFIPFFMFGWLPIIYFARVKSVPEYFERRFNTPCRILAVLIILEYMIGYIGYNLYTLGTAAHQVLGVRIETAIVAIAVVSCIYITAGGQTAVIFTDLMQGLMLLIAGFALLLLGLDYIALDGVLLDGLRNLWVHLDLQERLPFASFNAPPKFNHVSVFWQDGVAGSIAFLFVSQGLIMRFLAAKSMNEGRKCISFNVLFMLPVSMIVVGNAGWICNAAVKMGLLDPPSEARDAFVNLASVVCRPGVFGFVLAALSAALMSTIDTFTNATAALVVYDIYQPYLVRNQPDRHYLRAARFITVGASAVGLGLGLFFAKLGTDMYKLHAAFQSMVTPPIVVAVFLGAFWKRYTPVAAFCTLGGGMLAVWASKIYPFLVAPFATWIHGVQPDASGQYNYMTALYGLVVSSGIGIAVTLVTRPKPESEITGLYCSSIELARKFFKGGEPNFAVGKKVRAGLLITAEGTTGMEDATAYPGAPQNMPDACYPSVRLSRADMRRLRAAQGDLIYIGDARWWLGGLRSLHARVGQPHDYHGTVMVSNEAFGHGSFVSGREVHVEKLF